SIFGPLPFAQLARWASSAQVAPHDSISTDQANWIKAPMLPELAMDWIAEVTSERLYGPTTLGAIAEFLRLGEIDQETFVINSCDATRRKVRDLAPLLTSQLPEIPPPRASNGDDVAPASAGMAIAMQDRIRELEEALRDERRALATAEEKSRLLEAKLLESQARSVR
ncbi:MAG: hypothetical protein M3Y03_04700, partial [Verrucomicrobiota bacterium]|nr:hypothetical protein [Verrucomicrobiota bacterium]